MSPTLAIKSKVEDQGIAPDKFLMELISWAKPAPDEIFLPDLEKDIFSSVADVLGPYPDLFYRRGVICECLRVLAGFESSWKWAEGRDVTNVNVDKPENEEAGIFQVSFDSTALHPDLLACANAYVPALSPRRFIAAMKEDHVFAFEYAARLLSHTVNHNGPVKRKEINPFLKRAAVNEFIAAIYFA